MAIDQAPEVVLSSAKTHNTFEILPKSPQINQISVASQSGDTTERSFHSAKERTPREDVATQELKNAESLRRVVAEVERMQVSSTEPTAPILDQGFEDAMDVNVMNKDLDEDLVVDESRSPSQGSSPARTLVRKSSLTFAALPAREPLTTKKSIGARVSRTSHLDQCKAAVNRGSFLGRFTGGKSLGGLRQPEIAQDGEVNDEMDIDTERPTDSREESDGDSKMAKLHNKSSTQRLHDRINMLGKSQPPRPTKSIAAAVNIANSVYPDLSTAELSTYVTQPGSGLSPKAGAPSPVHDDDEVDDDEDDDWIQPPQTQLNGPNRPQLSKSISADVMEDIRGKQTIGSQDFSLNHSNEQAARKQSPLRDKSAYESRHSGIWLSRAVPFSQSASPAKAVEQAAPMAVDEVAALDRDIPAYGDTSTTPSGSPLSRRYVDGPLSASKSKLQSIMKTARGLFSSSAGVSAQAKMETLSPPSMRTHEGVDASSINTLVQSKTLEDNSTAVTSSNDIRKTRSSTDIEQKRKLSQTRQRQKAEEEPEWIREQESQKLLARKQAQTKTPAVEVSQLPMKPTRQSPRKTQNHEIRQSQPDIPVDDTSSHSMGLPVPHVQTQQPQLQRPKEVRRPIKPAKETAPKPKPQPVAIRVGTLSQRIPLTNATLSSGLQESLPSAQPKQPANGKKPSNASLQTLASNSSLKGSVTSVAPKPKALLAAERKKEQVSIEIH